VEELIEAHAYLSTSADAARFQTVCVDSITEIAETVLTNAKRQVKDPRQAYGAMIEHMLAAIKSFRDLPGKHVYFSAKTEQMKDEFTGGVRFGPMMPGAKLGQQLPYLFDEVLHLDVGKDNDGKSFRFLRTQPDFQFEAKDRSGVLANPETPDLGVIISKILGTSAPR